MLEPGEVHRIRTPTLICIGTKDDVAGDGHELARLFPNARAVDIPGRDHNKGGRRQGLQAGGAGVSGHAG